MADGKQIILDTLGDDFKEISPILRKTKLSEMPKIAGIDPEVLAEIQKRVEKRLSTCGTHREILEVEVADLAECIGVATEIYMKNPMPDFAFQLSTLLQTHKAILQQLDKMKDPKAMLGEIELQIRSMFLAIIKAMAIEIDKIKNEMSRLFPDQKITVDDLFSRMLNAIQPETQNIYDDIQINLKKILGINRS